MKITFTLNDSETHVDVSSNKLLLDLLRTDLGVLSVKKGCEQGECGVCTVLVDGEPVNSCLVLVERLSGRKVTTLEGLGDNDLMQALQKAFVEDGAIQCGFCTPGMLLSAYSLLRKNRKPSLDDVRRAIEGNLCRCTGYTKIIHATLDAAERMRIE